MSRDVSLSHSRRSTGNGRFRAREVVPLLPHESDDEEEAGDDTVDEEDTRLFVDIDDEPRSSLVLVGPAVSAHLAVGACLGPRIVCTVAAVALACALVALGLFDDSQRRQITTGVQSKSAVALVSPLWCDTPFEPPVGWPWKPTVVGEPIQVKVLTYNLQWWNLYGLRDGADGSAGKLIAAAGMPQMFDIMGFQECQDIGRVLRDAGLAGQYIGVQGSMSVALAYASFAWTPLGQGEETVAEDMREEYYGKRIVQWVRLRHVLTGKVVFFMNHHGPLELNSGGLCGGLATARNILRVITTNAMAGDAIIALGDFNANVASGTIAELGRNLYRAYSGVTYGGIDHIFTNLPYSQEQQNLGTGGSDHCALSVVLDIAGSALVPGECPGARLTTASTSSMTSTMTSMSSSGSTPTMMAPAPPEAPGPIHVLK